MTKLPITAIILAGGKGTRMGGKDKGLMLFKQQPIYLYIISKLKHQVIDILINANRNEIVYQQSGYAVFSDLLPDYQGPLAGIYSGLFYAKTEWVFFVSCDTPFIPENIIYQLWLNKNDSQICYVDDGEKRHPTICLIHKSLLPEIKQYLDGNDRKLQLFFDKQNAITVDYQVSKNDFININTIDELNYWNKQ